MKIGIDLGSTYSTFSYYNEQTGMVEALTPAEGESATIPSVVAISAKNSKNQTYGTGAKSKTGSKSFHTFEAFKMMLPENKPEVKERYHYNDEYTPQLITQIFLEDCLQDVCKRKAETDGNAAAAIESAVICVPEVWGTRKDTLDGREILLDIVKNKLDIGKDTRGIQETRIVTEPEAASAYFAYNYEHTTQKPFNGYLLLIDYGGGTLDLTIAKVTSDGKGGMEINDCDSGGEGTNHPDSTGKITIGHAGIAYMQTVIRVALEEQNLLDSDSNMDLSGDKFMKAVHDLEADIKSQNKIFEIEDAFDGYEKYSEFKKIMEESIYDPDTGEYDENFIFTELDYKDEIVTITYQHLFKAYQIAIEGVLKEAIDDINQKLMKVIDQDATQPETGKDDGLKIAVVGGFGSCYFVKAQLAELYNLDPNSDMDFRVRDIPTDKKEVAISFGAALIAADKVKLQKTAKYSLGVYMPFEGTFQYGIKYHQVIKPGTIYYMCMDENSDERCNYAALRGNIQGLVLEFSDNARHGGIFPLRQEAINKFDSMMPDEGVYYCGFSMDENETVTFHAIPSPVFNPDYKPVEIKLGRYGELFEMNSPKEIWK